MGCIAAHDPNLVRLANAIAARVGPQRFNVWFDSSTRLDLRNDNLEIAVPNDFIGEWINQRFAGTIQEAAVEVFGGPLNLRYMVQPELFDGQGGAAGARRKKAQTSAPPATSEGTSPPAAPPAKPSALSAKPAVRAVPESAGRPAPAADAARPRAAAPSPRQRLRHDLESYVVGASNQLAYNAAVHVSQFPGSQYNPLFIHGACGLGKTHLLQGLCQRFIHHNPTHRWLYLTGEEFTNDYVHSLKTGKIEAFRRRIRDVDLLVIDDVHFFSGKKATQEEFLHTFNAIEASGKQVVMASDSHPKEIAEFGESLVNRFVSGMVVRVDTPTLPMRCEILRRIAARQNLTLSEEVVSWVARRVTQNVRELEGAVNRMAAHVTLIAPGEAATDVSLTVAQQALGDLDRAMVAPVRTENVVAAVASHFGIEPRELMSGRRHHSVSLARSLAMYLVRKTARLSYPEIGARMGNRNHSTVISACRRIEAAVGADETLHWSGTLGARSENAAELVQRLEEQARALP